MTFFLYTLAGSLLTLLGVIALVVVHFQHSQGNVLTFSIPHLTSGLAELPWAEWRITDSLFSPQVLIFLLLLAGFAVKVPMFPFHTWLPLAHVEAPTAGSILLAGVLLKVGSYGLLRFNIGMTPLGATRLFPFLATLAVAGIIYGALAALRSPISSAWLRTVRSATWDSSSWASSRSTRRAWMGQRSRW